MSSATLFRLSGVSLLVGCLLLVIGDLSRVAAGTDPGSTLVASGWLVQAIGAMCVALGLPGVYLRHAPETGVLGLVGFIGTSLYVLIFGVFGGLLHGLVIPVLATAAPAVAKAGAPPAVGLAFFVAALLAAIGSAALGIATIRAGVLPRPVGALIGAGGLALLAGHPLRHVEDAGLIALLAGLAWMGLSVLSSTGHREPAPLQTSSRVQTG